MTFMPLLPAAFFAAHFSRAFGTGLLKPSLEGGLLLFLFTTIERDNIKSYMQWILIYP
jgi:hypothetical protein